MASIFRFRKLTFFFGVRAVIAVFLLNQLVVPPPVRAQSSSSADWFMVGANPQRTSWVSSDQNNVTEIRGNLLPEWYQPIEPYIPDKVQPIFSNGMAYIATSKGLYAFDLGGSYGTGQSRVKWIYPTELPLGNSPTVVTINGISTAYVPGYDHMIHAINALTGVNLAGYTPYQAQAGFETNPLVINDSYTNNTPTIYAGNRDGYFYALNAVTGTLIWRYQTQGPILFSAAYKNGTLFFVANDNCAYALNVGNGTKVWSKCGFEGAGFHSFWPVIYTEKSTGKDFVIFSGSENYRFGDNSNTYPWGALHKWDQQNIWGNCFPSNCPGGVIWPKATDNTPNNYWGHPVTTIDVSAITNYFQAIPLNHRQFIFNTATGQEYTPYAPITFAGGITTAGNKYPPVINGVDNVYYQDTMYYQQNWISRGDVVGWKWGDHFVSEVSGDSGHAVDEPIAYSSAGKLIYWNLCCDREAGAWDVTSPGTGWQYWGYNLMTLAPNYDPMYNDGSSGVNTEYTNMNGFHLYSGKNQSKNGVYMKHTLAQTPPVPYQGRLYFIRGNTLMAFSLTGGATSLSLASGTVTQNTLTPPTTAQLTQTLDTQVQKIVTAGPLRPGYHSAGLLDSYGEGWYDDDREFGEIFDYFQNPSDSVYTLLLAYPYLSATTQQQVKTYLQTHYGPGTTYDFTKIVHIGWGTGAAREVFTIPLQAFSIWGTNGKGPLNPSVSPICGGCGYWQRFPPFSFYAAWKYAQIVGNNDPTFAKNIFNLMNSKIEAPPGYPTITSFIINRPYFLNLYAAGYYGYLQLKQLAGLGGDTTVQGYYNTILAARINFVKDSPYWNTGGCGNDSGPCYNRTFAVARNFMFLTPEIADYMNKNISSSTLQDAISEYQYVAPYWFVSKFDDSLGEGTLDHLYNPPALFQAKAYILKEPYDKLVKYLDVPAFQTGDLFYIQNLTAALWAAQQQGFTPPPVATPTLGNGDVNGDGKVDTADVTILFTNWFDNLTTTLDQFGDGFINTLDFAVVSSRLTAQGTPVPGN
jgi:outer membrane protein assembly factor BamB